MSVRRGSSLLTLLTRAETAETELASANQLIAGFQAACSDWEGQLLNAQAQIAAHASEMAELHRNWDKDNDEWEHRFTELHRENEKLRAELHEVRSGVEVAANLRRGARERRKFDDEAAA